MDNSPIYYGAAGSTSENNAIAAAIKSGNINVQSRESETLALSGTSLMAQESHAHLLRRVEAERVARKVIVPTSIEDVKNALRNAGAPITLFGENAADRRERLRRLVSEQKISFSTAESSKKPQSKNLDSQLFYTSIKSKRLKEVRLEFGAYSFKRAAARLEQERLAFHPTEAQRQAEDSSVAALYDSVSTLSLAASQHADTRTISCVKYASDSKSIFTGSWTGRIKRWDATSCDLIETLSDHEERITGLACHPDPSSRLLLSASADCTAKLFKYSSSESMDVETSSSSSSHTFAGHQARLAKVAFHPAGDTFITASFDHTWCLWDIESRQRLQLQEGHYKPVYAIACHPDGALVATGDLAGIGRVWDLRSGKGVMALQGHSKQILSMDFSPGGTAVASGSEDRTVRVWDLRKQRGKTTTGHKGSSAGVYVVPAHSRLVSEIKYGSEETLVSASFDSTVRIWRTRDWKQICELKGHDGKISGVDLSKDGTIVSCGFDRTFKIWSKNGI